MNSYKAILRKYDVIQQGQLPGIRWGRGFHEDDVIQRGSKGKLWESMKKRITQHHHELAVEAQNMELS
ncbi:hypothetical protein ACROYT_G007425 [Oculina patagonica]